MPDDVPPVAPKKRTFGQWLRDLPRWEKVVLGVAVLAVVVGAVLSLTSSGGATAPGTAGGGNLGPMGTSFGPGGINQPTTAAAEEPASRGVFRLGFSFLAGFCIGRFIRAALKVAAIAFGFWLVTTFVLQEYGILVVDWNAMGSLWDRFASNVEREWGSFRTFMTGSLPTAGLAIAGLGIGLKRH
jgi:uncharacterized membrane protein (Fun14 family)